MHLDITLESQSVPDPAVRRSFAGPMAVNSVTFSGLGRYRLNLILLKYMYCYLSSYTQQAITLITSMRESGVVTQCAELIAILCRHIGLIMIVSTS